MFAAITGLSDGWPAVIALVLAVVAVPLFVLVERRADAAALVPLGLFRNCSFVGAIAATASMTFGIYGMIFLLPLTWQASGALSPGSAGLALMPCALVFFLIAPKSGHLAQRIGVRAMTAGGTALIGCGLLVLALTRAGLAVSLDVDRHPAGAPHWASAGHLLPDVLELLIGAPRGVVLTLNIPDRPAEALGTLRYAALAEFGAVQSTVDRVDDGQLRLAQVEVQTPLVPGTDSALLAAGHPTLTALESVREASGPALSQWLESAMHRIA